MFEQTFKNIDDILHKDAGCSSELDYVEQTSWVLFLKYLDDFEKDKKTAAELSGKPYAGIISPEYRWKVWAIRATKQLDNEFLFNFLVKHENEIVGNAGAVFNSINKTQIREYYNPSSHAPRTTHHRRQT